MAAAATGVPAQSASRGDCTRSHARMAVVAEQAARVVAAACVFSFLLLPLPPLTRWHRFRCYDAPWLSAWTTVATAAAADAMDAATDSTSGRGVAAAAEGMSLHPLGTVLNMCQAPWLKFRFPVCVRRSSQRLFAHHVACLID